MTQINKNQFITNNFINSKSKIHIEEIRKLLIDNGFEVDNKNTLLIKEIGNAFHKKITMDKNGYVMLILKPEQLKVHQPEEKENVGEFIMNNFKNTDDKKDKLHIENIRQILIDNGYNVGNKITTLFRELQLGIYDKNITIDKVKKAGFTNLIYNKLN